MLYPLERVWIGLNDLKTVISISDKEYSGRLAAVKEDKLRKNRKKSWKTDRKYFD